VIAPTKPRRQRATVASATVMSVAAASASTPRVLDSSCWLEFFADSAQADHFASAIEAVDTLVVPVLTVYEVVKKLAREAGDEVAAAALGLMQRGQVVPIDLNLALAAAVNGLPMADSLIYATARQHGAELWTQDRHFEGLPGVKFFAKP
jgi:predicted nucleic acid-binding protein